MTAPATDLIATPHGEAPSVTSTVPEAPQVLETAAELAQIDDRPVELVLIPEWHRAVRVRAFSASDRDSLEGETMVASKKPGEPSTVRYQDFRARLATRAIVDAKGDRLFRDDQWEQLAVKSAAALDRICTVALRLSRMGTDDIEKLVGESPAARPSASPTA